MPIAVIHPKTGARVAQATAADLPEEMAVSDPRGAYRVPVLQFVADWNRSAPEDRVRLIAEPPVYRGSDELLLPTIAAFVHALAVRDGVPVPNWVMEHRAPRDYIFGGWNPEGRMAQMVKADAVSVCAYHRVWFEPQMLWKGTDRWFTQTW